MDKDIPTKEDMFAELQEVKAAEKAAKKRYDELRKAWLEMLENTTLQDEFRNNIIEVSGHIVVREERKTKQYDMHQLEAKLRDNNCLSIASSVDMKKVKKLVSADMFPKDVFEACESEPKLNIGLVIREVEP